MGSLCPDTIDSTLGCKPKPDLTTRVTVAYDGTGFCGWQVQPGLRTVQGVLQEALSTLAGRPIVIHGSGRTDAGVHGIGQVFHFDGPFPVPVERLVRAVNSGLPEDVALQRAESVTPGFHARYDAVGKTYRYSITTQRHRNPLKVHYAWQLEKPLDVRLMTAAARLLEGTHDFASFAAAGSPRNSTVRTVQRIAIRQDGDAIDLEFTADGFLYHMVRNLAGTLADVGTGRIPPDAVLDILAARNRGRAGKTAPACGLYLLQVWYGNEIPKNQPMDTE